MKKFMSKACITFAIGFWYILVNFTYPLLAQGVDEAKLEQVKKAVVRITSKKQDDLVETGTGVIIKKTSRGNENICTIMTAYHVVEEAEEISVKFYHDRTIELPAELFERYEEDKDLAVIFVQDIPNLEVIKTLEVAAHSTVGEIDRIFTIGHPRGSDWYLSSGEIRLSEDILFFAFSRETIDPGNSGGPLLNDNFQLIGLVVRKRTGDGQALKISHAKEILNNWGISNVLEPLSIDTTIVPPKPSSKKWIWSVGGVIGAGGLAALIISQISDGAVDGNGNGGNGLPRPPDPVHP